VIAFIILIIVLYFLSTQKTNQDQNNSLHPITRDVSKKENHSSRMSQQEKKFLEYFGKARDYYQSDDLKSAEKMINLAREIMTTDELADLEKRIQDKKKEREIIEGIDIPDSIQTDNSEEVAFQRAIKSNNILICQEFLEKYPSGKHGFEVRKKIEELKKQDRKNLDQQLNKKLQLYFKNQLRTDFTSLSQQETQDILKGIKPSSNQIENRLIDGDPVIIDYTLGLMWHQWDKTINFKKAKWWANRRYAGYVDWRLPTAEEASTLSEKIIRNTNLESGIQFQIWTGDVNRMDSSQSWVYSPFSRKFKAIPEDQYKNLWSVRVMTKNN
jgi:hypothetical protein